MSTATAEPAKASPVPEGFFTATDAPKGNPSDLFKRFQKETDPSQQEKPQESAPSANAGVTEELSKEEKTAGSEPSEPEKSEKKKPFVKNLISSKHELEAKNQELEGKVKKYETEELPARQQEIESLKKQIEDGGSKAELEKLRGELKTLQDAKSERENQLIGEVEEAKKRLSFYDIQNDPDFVAKFVQPITQSYGHLQMVLGGDQAKIAELNKAIAAHRASLTLKDPAQSAQQFQQAREIANNIYDQLNDLEKAQFNQGFWDLVNKAQTYQQALNSHELTKKQIEEERNRLIQDQAFKTKARWREAFKQSGEKLSAEIKYPEEVARIITAQKIDDNTSLDDQIAQATIEDGAANYPPEDIARVLQQGAKHRSLLAYIKAQEIQLKEQEETIKKLRGSGTAGDSPTSMPSGSSRKESEEKTPQTLFARFQQKAA